MTAERVENLIPISASVAATIATIRGRQRGPAVWAVKDPSCIEPDDGEFDDWVAESRDALNDRRWTSSIPQRFHGARLTDFDDGDLRGSADAVRAWSVNADRRNVVILGPVGSGKSRLAAAMVRQACDDALDVKLITCAFLLDLLRPGGPETALDDLLCVDRLVVDDVGAERPTDWSTERLGLLVDQRWSDEVPTIFTSNLGAKELEAHVGPRTYSRMVGGAVKVLLLGADRRNP